MLYNIIMCNLILFTLISYFLGIQGSRLPKGVIANLDDRVVGGEDVPEGLLPHQASLRLISRNYHFCGGSVLNNRWILTAAHCTISQSTTDIEVVLGTVNRLVGGTHYPVEKIVIHNEYHDEALINDISLVKTSQDIEFTDLVQPIALPEKNTKAGTTLLLSGWGTTSFPGSPPTILQMINLTALSLPDCQKRHKEIHEIFETQICTLTGAGKGACHGDSGGPLVEFSSKTLVGVVSWGMPCARGYPDVYSRVYAYRQWILDSMSKDAMQEFIINK